MQSGRILIIVGAVILVIVLIIGALVLVPRILAPQPTPEPTLSPEENGEEVVIGPPEGMQEIVVAAQNIPRGVRVTEDNNAVKMVAWPADSVPEGALFEIETAYGRIARVDVVRGMPVTEGMLTQDAGELGDTGSDAALMIPKGRVGYAVAVAGNASVAWAIQPGDRVDVLLSMLIVDLDEEFQTELPNQTTTITQDEEGNEQLSTQILGRLETLPDGRLVMVNPREEQRPRMLTQLTVQDAIVIGVGSWEEKDQPPEPTPVPTEDEETEETAEATPPPTPPRKLTRWVTLAVAPQDALILKYAEETGASIDFVLRSADDAGTVVTTDQVSLDYIFNRYQMEAPPKLPYGVTPPVQNLRPGATGEVVSESGTAVEYSRLHTVTGSEQGETQPPVEE